ncbi:hypothetical protein LB467_01835 [Salegentibacter sp. JZCK2]|uniref:LamG-like jellyroll fold domain-containing protein n=1 Tax=Salegentibacter tibetensis TaxID=2873600 RepID=UPI001CCCDD06|nr:LamG-like jellyroll fold domain-containing protein [Salegentibacter tibetensis]MBZ9728414.1 hypothetical protein [Salegentibacter tibetensis]
MGKKLLSLLFIFSIFFLNPVDGFGQCPSSVSISSDKGTEICEGTSVTFTANPTDGMNLVYQWQINESDVGTASTSNIYTTSTLSNADKVRVIVTSNTESCTFTSSALTMTVNAALTVSFEINATATTICSGQSVTFSHGPITNGGTNPSYQWLINGINVTGATSKDFTTTTLNNGDQVSLEVTADVKCATEVPATSTNTIAITVEPDATIGLSSGDTNQSVCAGVSINPIIYDIGGTGNNATITGLPDGISGTYNSTNKTFTISGSSTSTGIFEYAVTATGTCADSPSLTGSITINPDATISEPSNKDQTVCIDTAITSIVFTVGGGATGAGVSGLPEGISGSFADGKFTISGTPTVSGTFNYTVTTTGSCVQTTATGIITVTANATISEPTNKNQTLCIDTALSPIAFTIGGGGTGATVSGLPTGVTGSFSGDKFTISGTPSVFGSFSYTVTTTGNCVQTSASGTIEVNPDATIALASSNSTQTVCAAGGVSGAEIAPIIYSVGETGTGATAVGLPSGITGSYNSIDKTFTISGSTATTGTHTYTVTATGTCQNSESLQGTITVNENLAPAVSIASDDADNIICSGTSVKFTATATNGGASPSYQWYLNNSSISGATNSTYTSTGLNNNDVVKVVMTSNATCLTTATAESNSIQTQVDSPISSVAPEFDNTDPSHNPTGVCPVASGLIYTVKPISGATSYNWTFPSGWTASTGTTTNGVVTTTTNSVTVTAASTAISGDLTVNGRNECGPTPGTKLALSVDSFAYASAGPDQVVCAGTTSIKLAGEIGGVITKTKDFTWSASVSGGSFPGGNLENQLNGDYTLPSSIVNGGTVTLTITTIDPQGPCEKAVDSMVLTVLSAPTISDPANKTQSVCNNTPITSINFTVGGSANGATVTGLPAGITGTYSDSNKTFTLSGTPTEVGTFNYTVTTTTPQTTSGTCTQATQTGTITVKPIPTVAKPANIIACNGEAVSELIFSGSVEGTTFAWTNSDISIGLAASGTGNIPSFEATNTTSQPITATITITPTANGCEGPSETFSITVNPNITVTKPENIIACNGATVSDITFSGTVTGTTFKWTNDNTSIGLAASGTGNILGFTATNTTSQAITANITVTPVVDDCEGTPETFSITVNPTATVTKPANVVVCNGAGVPAISFSGSSVTGTTYKWTNDNTAIGLAASGTGDIAAFTATNDTDSPIIATIVVTPVANECEGTSQSFTVTINPTPTVTKPADIVVCNGEAVAEIVLSGSVGGTTYTWTNDNTAIGLAASGTGNIPGFTATNTNTTNVAITATITITPSANSCDGVVQSFNVRVDPTTTVDAGADQIICSNETASMNAVLGGGATSGIWTTSGSGSFSNNTPTAVYTPSSNDVSTGAVTLTYTTNDPDGPCMAVSDSIILTIKEKVIITTQPQNIGVCVTSPASLSVVAYGDDLTYQWFKGTAPGTAVANSANITGANAATLKFNQASLNDAATYYVVVSGDSSCETVKSNEVTLNVNKDITIDEQPVSQIVCEGTDVIFSITATGSIASYQWRKNSVNISGANTASFTIPAASVEDSNKYDVVITGTGGTCPEAYSEVVTLTVNPTPVIDAVGSNMEICFNGDAYNITNGASVTNAASVKWTVPAGSGTIANETSLTEATFTPAENVTDFVLTLTAYGLEGCSEVIATKEIKIQPLPTVDSITYSGSATEFCTNSDIAAPVVSGTNAFSGGTFSWKPATGEPSGNILNLVTVAETGFDPGAIKAGSDPGLYDITYSTPTGAICEVVSKTIQVTITQLPLATFTYTNSPFCKTSANPSALLDAGSSAGVFSSTTGLVFVNTSTGELNLSESTPGTYTITNTIAAAKGCEEVSSTFEIVINDEPIPDFTYSASKFCSDNTNPIAQFAGNAIAGTFSEKTGNSGLIFVSTSTGEIDLAASTPGIYTVINTVDLEGDGCDPVIAEFTITIEKLPDASFSYDSPAYCQSSGVTPAPVISGDAGGTFTASIGLVVDANGVIDVAASTANNPNDETDVHTVTYTFAATDTCKEVSTTVNVRIDSPAIGGELTFGEFGRLFTTCEITERNTGLIADLILSNYSGKIEAWNYKTFSGTVQTVTNTDGSPFTGSTLPGSKIESLGLSETTVFQVILSSGSCTTAASKSAILSVISSDIEPTPVTADKNAVCLGDPVILTAGSGYEEGADIGEGGAFDNSSITNHGWTIIRSDGSEGNFNSSADNGRAANWLRTNPVDLWTANINDPSSLSLVRYDTGATDGNKGFAAVSGNFPGSKLITPVFSITSMDQAILTFDQAYNLTDGSYIMVEITTDGGATWQQLYIKEGPANSGHANNFGGGDIDSRPENKIEIDLSAYMGMNNLQIRFNYQGNKDGNVWVVDEIMLPNGPNVGMVWRDHTGETSVIIGHNYTETWYPKEIGWNISDITTTLEYSNGSCETAVHSEKLKVFVFDNYTTSVSAEMGSCGNYSAKLTATATGSTTGIINSYPTPDGYMGEWKIEGGTYQLNNTDPAYTGNVVNNPNVTITADNFGTLMVSWELVPTAKDDNNVLIDNTGCLIAPEILEVNLNPCIALDFDGVDDYVDLGTTYTGNYSFEAWIRPEASTGTIISGPNFEINMENLPIGVNINSRWYHIAVSNNKIYVDGIEIGSFSLGNSGEKALIGARWNNANSSAENYFSGWIEEVRIWNGSLTEEQIRFMMNQRLYNNGTQMGVEIPMDVPGGLNFGNLEGYYQLLADPGLVANGTTIDLANISIPGRLVNMETFQVNTAPLPYTSRIDGQNWAIDNTWTHFDVWDAPNSNGIDGTTPIDWNIVRTSHNISSGNKDITVLGLLSEEKELLIADPRDAMDEYNTGQFIRVSHYLKLNGFIDLVGESQLLQDEGSVLEEASSGYLERDQQGTQSSYNYNYWSSPVSLQNSFNNSGYTIGGILMDGTNSANPVAISFRNGHFVADGERATPIIISNSWLYGFNGRANEYGDWDLVGSAKMVKTGEGFTMKGTSGSASIDMRQNYVFRGKPHNGNFTLYIGPEMNYLTGNPYPSALDAREFILDNLSSADVSGARNTKNIFNGVIYFWDHFGGQTHILREYVGGYAAYSLAGGVNAISKDERINDNNQSGTKIPKDFIAVAQGFFLNTALDEDIASTSSLNVQGGDIVFRNAQRRGVRESSGNSIFLKPLTKGEKTKTPEIDERAKIRLKFHSPKGYHRQILVTRDNSTTNGFDLGYDAPLIEDNLEDMYWLIDSAKVVIQAVPDFEKDQVLPFGIKAAEEGYFKIQIDSLENFPDEIPVYLNDKLSDSIHDLKERAYDAVSTPGEIHDRFEIVFHNPKLVPKIPKEPGLITTIDFGYNHNTRELRIDNPELIEISEVLLFDLGGKLVKKYTNIPREKQHIININQVGTSVYIVKLITTIGHRDKKFIMK